MIVYIFRHGPAVDVGDAGVRRDTDRMLSDDGRRKTAGAAQGLRVCGCAPERIFSSPLIRARETAEIAARALGVPDKVTIAGELSPDADPDGSMAWLAGLTGESVMLVGHLPSLAELASLMISGRSDLDIVLKKASLCCIVFADRIMKGQGRLEWLLQPATLRQLGG